MIINLGFNSIRAPAALTDKRRQLRAAAIVFCCLSLLAANNDKKQPDADTDRPAAAEKRPKEVQSKAAEQKKEEVTIAATEDDLLKTDIFFGQVSDQIANPRCVDIGALLRSMPETKEANRNMKSGNQARYWILLSQANDRMNQAITNYAKAHKISFLCKRDGLFALLRRQDKYKNKSDAELIAAFDITDRIIESLAEKSQDGKIPSVFFQD